MSRLLISPWLALATRSPGHWGDQEMEIYVLLEVESLCAVLVLATQEQTWVGG